MKEPGKYLVNSTDHWLKINERKKIYKYLDVKKKKQICIKQIVEHEGDDDTNCNWYICNGNQRFGEKKTKRIVNQRKNRDYLDRRVFEIDINTEKSPANLKILAIALTPLNSQRFKL